MSIQLFNQLTIQLIPSKKPEIQPAGAEFRANLII